MKSQAKLKQIKGDASFRKFYRKKVKTKAQLLFILIKKSPKIY